MSKRNVVWTAFAASFLVASLSAYVQAGSSRVEKTVYVTFSGSVRLPGTSLPAGTYIFEIANPLTSGDIVRVVSRDRRTSYFMGFTTPVPKPPRLRENAMVSFGESVRGTAPPIMTWWPVGESTGRQFKYND
jgi:hypothetical protein